MNDIASSRCLLPAFLLSSYDAYVCCSANKANIIDLSIVFIQTKT